MKPNVYDQAVNDPMRNPLAPINMKRAGVPEREAIWFHALPAQLQMKALLYSLRGVAILERTRNLMQTRAVPYPAH